MNGGSGGSFSTQGQAIYDALKGHSNLFLMLCGHVPDEGRRSDIFAGNTVYTLLADYQSRTTGGNGWMRILEFSPANNEIRVKTYSPVLDQWETDANSQFGRSLFENGYPLEGSGKDMRHVKIRSESELEGELLPELIRKSIELDLNEK